VNRRDEPEASMPREVAHVLLDSLPRGAVLFVAGDNDTYPLWYAQQVEGRRRDVTVVTMPLLGAPWYVAEIERRYHLDGVDPPVAPLVAARRIADAARAAGRPVAVSLTVPKEDRTQLGTRWIVLGPVALAVEQGSQLPIELDSLWTDMPVARKATEEASARIAAWRQGRDVRPATDPIHEYFLNVLSCPQLALTRTPSAAQLVSLDSVCNLR
jgi:hypothetical protein